MGRKVVPHESKSDLPLGVEQLFLRATKVGWEALLPDLSSLMREKEWLEKRCHKRKEQQHFYPQQLHTLVFLISVVFRPKSLLFILEANHS